MRRESRAHGIIENVVAMRYVIVRVAGCDDWKAWAARPRSAQFTSRDGGESALDVLNTLLQRNPFLRSDEEMEVVRHDHELVQFEFSLGAIRVERVNQELGGVCLAKKFV